MKYTYKTTTGKIAYYERVLNKEYEPDDPEPSFDDDTWELVSSCALGETLYWFWRKELI